MILLDHIQKNWPRFSLAIDRLEIGEGEYFVALGPSGAGKSVLLQCLAGLLRPDAGRIWFGERDVTALAPERRAVGWVSQTNTLFPHLTVARNIAFGRRYAREGRDGFDARARRLTDLLEIGHLLDRRPAGLSGGEAQRVMLARALARAPRVLLLDEPLRGLDPMTQERLREELARVHRELATTTVHITHNHAEARALADRLAVLRAGRLEQVGAADAIFDRPATPFVARFVGIPNVFSLNLNSSTEALIPLRDALPIKAHDATHLAVQPEDVQLLWPESCESGPDLRLKGVVRSVSKQRMLWRVLVECAEVRLVVLAHARDYDTRRMQPNTAVSVRVEAQRLILLTGPDSSGTNPTR